MICCLCYHEIFLDVLQDCYMAQVTLPQPTLVHLIINFSSNGGWSLVYCISGISMLDMKSFFLL